ncbi:HAD hydrolase-like protein [Alkalihalobacterium chitinilyticum]|uniref:HAD hydrolase-like protein n=1 Tax=Alkalihalobacterium chitinilyticum TaxID=2980103 RepID=A0ABT5VFV3_9BACI|nr:HAD hydrolase-like protein [Alkalihalobacterium chitinilyticum]MDE5414321.1 HAD hydrolase-like protein [Alkalihalobacterium chitinilyticum]
MDKYKLILFDLDGTLSDPKVGITKSVQYALHKMDIVEPDIDKLECFIGPPLQVSLAEYYNFDETNTQKAIDFYRERFKEKGMFENKLYSNIPLLLKSLKEQGVTYGYGSFEELSHSNPTYIVNNVDQLKDILMGSEVK